MAFFDEIDAITLIEENVARMRALEDGEGERLVRLFRRVRARLQENLKRMAAQDRLDTFTAQQNRAVLIQLEGAIRAVDGSIFDSLSRSAGILSEQGVSDLVEETQAMSQFFTGSIQPINIDAALIAEDSSTFLINQYRASITRYSEGLRARIAAGLAETVLEPVSLSRVVDRIGEFFGGEEWQVLRIARTELHNIYSASKIAGMRALGQSDMPDLRKTLYHPQDQRTAADSMFLIAHAPRMIRQIDEPFAYWWCSSGGKDGKGRGSFDGSDGAGRWTHRVFQNPPDRPNDRSILIPYSPRW